MSMRHHADLFATVGEYTDQDGKKAKRRVKVGAIFRDGASGAMSIKLDVIPVAREWSGWISVANIAAPEPIEQVET